MCYLSAGPDPPISAQIAVTPPAEFSEILLGKSLELLRLGFGGSFVLSRSKLLKVHSLGVALVFMEDLVLSRRLLLVYSAPLLSSTIKTIKPLLNFLTVPSLKYQTISI